MSENQVNLRDVAEAKILAYEKGYQWKEWNIQCLTLHDILKEYYPELTRGALDDNVTFVLLPRNENENGYQKLGGIKSNDSRIKCRGSFWDCIDYIQQKINDGI